MKIEGHAADGRPLRVEAESAKAAIHAFLVLIKALDNTEPVDADAVEQRFGFQLPREDE